MKHALKKLLFALSILLMFPVSAHADTLTADQLNAAVQIENKLAVVKDLADHELITAEQLNKAQSFYMDQASEVVGHAITKEQFRTLTSATQKAEGFGVFLNTMIVIAGIFLLLSALGLITYYLRDFLRSLPSSFYECASYVATAGLLVGGYVGRPFQLWFLTFDPLWLVVPGTIAFAACVYLTYWLHWVRPRQGKQEAEKVETSYVGPGFFTFPTVLSGLCAIVWGAIAISYHQAFPDAGIPHFVAFIAVMALQAFLGFSVLTFPGCIALGWDSDKKIARSTVASLWLLVAYVATILSGSALPESVKLFETGCLFMGAFVYYLGLLVMSSKYYHRQEKYDEQNKKTIIKSFRSNYLLMQAVTILSGLAAFYLGNSFHIGTLLGIGGTFFTIYLLEKYYEIPWKGVGWTWSLLGVAVSLYFFVGFAQQHPQLFVWGIV